MYYSTAMRQSILNYLECVFFPFRLDGYNSRDIHPGYLEQPIGP